MSKDVRIQIEEMDAKKKKLKASIKKNEALIDALVGRKGAAKELYDQFFKMSAPQRKKALQILKGITRRLEEN